MYMLSFRFSLLFFNKDKVMITCCVCQVVATDQKVESCSIQDVELHVTKVFVISASLPRLPLQVRLILYFIY